MIGDAMMSGGSFVFGDLFEMKDNLRRLHDWRLEKLRGEAVVYVVWWWQCGGVVVVVWCVRRPHDWRLVRL